MKIGPSHHEPGLHCPKCGVENDGAAGVGDNKRNVPKPGDYTICVYCETISRYTATGKEPRLKLKAVTGKALKKIPPENRYELDQLKPLLAKVWGPLGSRKPGQMH